MPNSEESKSFRRPDRQAMVRLEEAIVRTLGEIRSLRERARSADERVARLEGLLDTDGSDEAPGRIVDRFRRLEEENQDLRERLARSRAVVDRILARIRFLEEHK